MSSKLYPVVIQRNAYVIETISAAIKASSQEEATEIATAFANGDEPNWPAVMRYTVEEVTPLTFEPVSVEVGSTDDS